ncbi:hypothetical protein PROFUN_13610 [Planoprotostelium fungivorum]|uniref:Importin N-terminal domain-containing protein n=1 Tax=Planoprotostelium fungivorum TaxID=1890364 RepID=A0A2P6N3P4_9EUKA|nr:hypothetical protein PROFUN_13610 [Planoprotostelium fungivorum]
MEEVPVVEDLLRRALQPNTQIVMEAGKQLNTIMKKPKSIETLFIILHNSQYPEVRQMAGVMLRKKIAGHWGKQSDVLQAEIKKSLLTFLTSDPDMNVRRSVANVISTIATVLLPAGQWPELLQFLFECTRSPQIEHRELAMDLFDTLTENIGEILRPHFTVLTGIFRDGLKDPESRVRVASLKAVGSLVGWLSTDAEVNQFKELVPLMIQVIGYCVENDMEEEVTRAFEVFDDLAEMTEIKSLATITPDIVRLALQIGSMTNVSLTIRKTALTYIEWIVNYRPKSLTKHKIIPSILEVAIAMCSEADEEDLEEGELTAHKSASQLIDMITTRIPSNATFQPIMEILPRYIKDPSPDKRRAAITVLSVMCEGCADKMINPKYLSHELQWVCSSTTDQDVNVREASIVCLGHFSKFLQPEIMEFSSTVLPLLFQGINDSDERVIKASCYSLEAFCSDLSEEEIAPYVDGLVGRLTGVISSTKNKQLQELALSALSSTAAASGVAFINYAPSLLPPLISFMELSDADHIQLRCTATECVGLIAASIGKDAFAPYLNRTVALALDGCKSDYEELREYTYSFFCNIAELLLLDFKVYIPEILPFILKSITSEDGIQFDEEEQEESIISDDEEEGGGGALHVRTAFLQEKSAACHAIGVFAKCAGGQYILESRYIDHVASAFAGVREYFHEDVKVEVDSAEKEILLALHKASGVQYVPCAPVVSQPALHNNVVQYMDVYLPAIIERITKDVDKEVVGNACGCIGAVVAELGPRVLEKYMSAILDAFTMITSKKTMSQQDQEDEEGEEDEQFEMEMIVCAFDMIVSISKTLRADMLPYFQFICNAIAPYQRSESENYRSAAVGLLAEMCNAMGSSIAQYVPQLIEVSFKGMQDESAEVRSNSTFFCGVLLQHAGIAAHNYYPRTLEMLSTSIDDDSLPNIIDNSCGALCRMIMTAPHLVPLGQVLPTLMDHLPLRRDMEENTTVYKALFHLYNSQDQALMAVLPKMISCFGRASATPLEKDLFEEMQRIIKSLAQQHPQAFESAVQNQCTPAERENIKKIFSS